MRPSSRVNSPTPSELRLLNLTRGDHSSQLPRTGPADLAEAEQALVDDQIHESRRTVSLAHCRDGSEVGGLGPPQPDIGPPV